jgi:hypothetical protein
LLRTENGNFALVFITFVQESLKINLREKNKSSRKSQAEQMESRNAEVLSACEGLLLPDDSAGCRYSPVTSRFWSCCCTPPGATPGERRYRRLIRHLFEMHEDYELIDLSCTNASSVRAGQQASTQCKEARTAKTQE